MSKTLLTVTLNEQELRLLDLHCARSGKTAADLVRAWIESLKHPPQDPQETIADKLLRLSQEIETLRQEKADLEILLETTTEHSDTVEAELHDQAVAALRQSEEWFRTIAEATPTPILICRLTDQGEILYANAMAGLTFGVAVERLVGRSIQEFYADAGDRAQTLTLLQQAGSIQNHEIQLQRANGSPFWVTASLRQLKFNGEPTALSAFFDITQRKQAEDALRIAEAKYRSIFENALEGIFQAAHDGEYISVNPAMARLLGYESAEDMMATVGASEHLIYVDPTCRDRLQDIIQTQGEVQGFECQVYRKDGSVIWISESTRAVRDDCGNLLYVEGIVEDITLRKQREEELKRQVAELRIEIDQAKLACQVSEITQADYFQEIRAEVQQLRYSTSADCPP